jgi:hypothetical protein
VTLVQSKRIILYTCIVPVYRDHREDACPDVCDNLVRDKMDYSGAMAAD